MFNIPEADLVEQKSDTSDAPVFTLVTTGIQATIRNNGLYCLVQDLLSQDLSCEYEAETKESVESTLLVDYRVSALTADKAFLIHLTEKPENVLFPEAGFEFQGSHLRVDALFAKANTLKAKKGFSACHYTAEYKNSHTNELIVVHAYIGKNGIISYQTKKYKSESDKIKGIGEDLPVNSTLKDMIQKNAESAVTLSEKLEKEKHKRSMKAKEASYKIDANLDAVLQKILINSNQSGRLQLKVEYGELLSTFLAVVEVINRYSDEEIDQRGVLLRQFYALMNRPVVAIKTTELKEANENQIEPADSLDTVQPNEVEESPSIKPKSKEELQLEEDAACEIVLIEEIKTLMKKLGPLIVPQKVLDTGKLILRQTLKQTVNLKLIELAFLSSITQKNDTYLVQVATELNKISTLLEAFKKAVEFGELERVIQLYPYVQNESLEPIFYRLISEKLVSSSGEELNKTIAIAEFFFEHSNRYRQCIRVFDLMLVSRRETTKYSLLFSAFLEGNYLAFELMLNQGFNPNGVGLVCEEVTASVLHAIVCFMGEESSEFTDTRYITALLTFDALVDKKTANLASNTSEAFSSVAAQKISKKLLKENKMHITLASQAKKLQIREEGFDALELKKILSFDSALKMLCFVNEIPKIELLTLLASESSLSSLVLSIASLINVRSVNTRLVVGVKELGFFACNNVTTADLVRDELLSISVDKSDKRYVVHIAYHTNPAQEEAWCQNLGLLINALSEKYDEILAQDPAQIDRLDTFLMEKAKKTEDLLDKTNLLRAALYLQLFNSQLSFQNAQKIVQRLCYIEQAYSCNSLVDPLSKIRCKTTLNSALSCCTDLACSKELQATPLFAYTIKRLKLLGASPKGFRVEADGSVTVTIGESYVSDLKQSMGVPLTLVAQNHAKQAPSLSALANDETRSATPVAQTASVASSKENPKEKKKKKKKR